MGKGIYTYYKERLIEIGGNSKCLYLKNVVRKGAYDIGRLFEGRDKKVAELVDFLWSTPRYPLTLVSKSEYAEIAEVLGLPERSKRIPDIGGITASESERTMEKFNRQRSADTAKIVENEIAKINELKREIEEIEKETGRYELYIGYPFVFGSVNRGGTKTLIKAPLLLFPVKIEVVDENTVELRHNENEKIQINRALVYAYAQSKKLDIEGVELEFDDLSAFKSVKAVCGSIAPIRRTYTITASSRSRRTRASCR